MNTNKKKLSVQKERLTTLDNQTWKDFLFGGNKELGMRVKLMRKKQKKNPGKKMEKQLHTEIKIPQISQTI